jgi:hypothetical protein
MAIAAFGNRLIAFAACASLCAAAAFAAPAQPPAAMDQSRIHAYYTDGEFDKVIKDLDAFLKSRRACSHAESVFVEKHLSVVYAAHPATRELGRYHMYRLLDLAPGSDLLDMFVGEEVGGVFDKVGKEYALRNPSKAPAQKSAATVAKSAPAAKPTAVSNVNVGSNAKTRPAPAKANAAPSADNRILAMVNARPLPAAEPRPAHPAAAASAPVARTPVSYRLPAPRPSPAADKRTASRDSAAAPKDPAARPAWKEPGLWIGGGAAMAVVAFTLFYSGPEQAPAGKTYVVPATAAR